MAKVFSGRLRLPTTYGPAKVKKVFNERKAIKEAVPDIRAVKREPFFSCLPSITLKTTPEEIRGFHENFISLCRKEIEDSETNWSAIEGYFKANFETSNASDSKVISEVKGYVMSDLRELPSQIMDAKRKLKLMEEHKLEYYKRKPYNEADADAVYDEYERIMCLVSELDGIKEMVKCDTELPKEEKTSILARAEIWDDDLSEEEIGNRKMKPKQEREFKLLKGELLRILKKLEEVEASEAEQCDSYYVGLSSYAYPLVDRLIGISSLLCLIYRQLVLLFTYEQQGEDIPNSEVAQIRRDFQRFINSFGLRCETSEGAGVV